MPTDLLLPAFALTLIANFVLVAAAIHALRARSVRDEADRSADQARLAARRLPVATEPDRRDLRPSETIEPGERQLPRMASEPGPGVVRAPDPAPDESPTPPEEPEPEPAQVGPHVVNEPPPNDPPKPARRRRVAAQPGPGPTPKPPSGRRAAASRPEPRTRPDQGNPRAEAASSPGSTRRGGRRRFSLPPLDDDHERVNRSIETFFSGGDALDSGDSGRGPATVATTVAVVAIDGIDQNRSRDDRTAFEAVAATVERTLRGAARGDDRVTATGRGRFRIVLPGTGELAARTYLRRVRAAVAPSLESAEIPLSLVTATSTVLGEAPEVAIAQAEARLDAALASAASREPGNRPRAASD
jgi:GGDEF domain-containing protein